MPHQRHHCAAKIPPALWATGGLTIFLFPLPQPLLPLRGRVYPSPYPIPWTWRGPVARCQSVFFGPRRLQEGLRALSMASKIAQYSHIALPPRSSATKKQEERNQQFTEQFSNNFASNFQYFEHVFEPLLKGQRGPAGACRRSVARASRRQRHCPPRRSGGGNENGGQGE